jgi:hypothetical protein
LLAVLGSVVSDVMLAEFVIVPAAWGLILIEMLRIPPLGIFPIEQVTVPDACEQLPAEGVAETKTDPGGRVSVTLTLVAVEGPAFWRPTEYVSSAPAGTGSGESVVVIERSAAGFTVVAALALLLPVLGSLTFEATVAVFVIEPVACGRTTICTVAFAPFATVPSEHETVTPVCEHVPCDGVADSNVTLLGSVSVS